MSKGIWRRLLLPLVLLVLFYGVSVASSSKPKLGQSIDKDIIRLTELFETSLTCSAPCWKGLVPDVSVEHDVRLLLKESDDEQVSDLRYIEDHGNGYSFFRWQDETSDLLIDAVSFEQRLEHLAFHPWGRNGIDLTLSDVIETIGEPRGFSSTVLLGRHGEVGLFMTAFYEEIGVAIITRWWEYVPDTHPFYPHCEFEISPDLPVQTIQFRQVDFSAERLVYGNIATWSGYGRFELTECVQLPGDR